MAPNPDIMANIATVRSDARFGKPAMIVCIDAYSKTNGLKK
jgi:hypothetical protein